MCGIVGAVSKRDVADLLINSLKRLEYRGYDSAGVAVLDREHGTQRARCEGKVAALQQHLSEHPLMGTTGIAHTRWATHGKPCERNAHPHMSSDDLAIVHNGIIENHVALREQLIAEGYVITSDTDSELIAHLVHRALQKRDDLRSAIYEAVTYLEGAFSIGVIHKAYPHRLIGLRQGSPLVIGLGKEECFIASDSLALLPLTKTVIYLEDGDFVDIDEQQFKIFDKQHLEVKREIHTLTAKADDADLGEYAHFMLKEIHEQPTVFADALEGRIGETDIFDGIFGPKAPAIFDKTQRIHLVACGTSYHAGLVARYWLEKLTGLPTNVEIASEYRYRDVAIEPNTLFVTISQSGETADTAAALNKAKSQGYLGSLSICNVPESTLVRASDLVLMTRAGREIGVASTKAFTTQLIALMLFALSLAKQQGASSDKIQPIIEALHHLPTLAQAFLSLDEPIKQLAKRFEDKQHALFLGRGLHYPIALEGALKLKEISYIHAEAYPAGELKHGPLALVDDKMPVIAVSPNDELQEKLLSNIHEVRARHGELIIFADPDTKHQRDPQTQVIEMPAVPEAISPILHTIPLQLLAYHVALLKGTDVDQPRNLAKSVTVE